MQMECDWCRREVRVPAGAKHVICRSCRGWPPRDIAQELLVAADFLELHYFENAAKYLRDQALTNNQQFSEKLRQLLRTNAVAATAYESAVRSRGPISTSFDDLQEAFVLLVNYDNDLKAAARKQMDIAIDLGFTSPPQNHVQPTPVQDHARDSSG